MAFSRYKAHYKITEPEVEQPSSVWRNLGAVSGFVVGFIFGNLPGAIMGGSAGSWGGSVRDHKGKSVMEAFHELNGPQRAELLTHLAQKLFASAILQ